MRVVDTSNTAHEMFRTFHARDPRKKTELPFSWPATMREIGVGQAEMYRSNKWQKRLSEFEAYKHIAEDPRRTYAREDLLVDAKTGRPMDLHGPLVEFREPMPQHFTELGQLIGVQVLLYGLDEKGNLTLADGEDGNYYEVRMRQAKLGGTVHPKTGEPFLLVYTEKGGVHMIITGDRLDIERGGITG
jgi:hypothetical protein